MKGPRARPRFRLLWRILGLMVFVSLVPMAALGFVLHQRIQSDLEIMANHEMEMRLNQTAANITGYVDGHLRTLRSVAALLAMTGMKTEEQEPVLVSVQQTYPEFSIVGSVGLNGQFVARSDRGPASNNASRAYFKEITNGASEASEIDSSRSSGSPALVIAVPIMQSGSLRGVLSGTLDLKELTVSLEQTRIGKTGYAWLVDAQGRVMAHRDLQKVGAQADVSEQPAVVFARSGGTGTISYEDGGKRWMAVSRALPQGWVLVVQMEEAEAFAQAVAFQRLFPLVMVGALLVVLLLAWLAAFNLTRPIRAMAAFVDLLAEGDLTANLTLRRSDELGDMADALRQMRDKLRIHVADVQGGAGRVAKTATDLGVAVAVAAESGTVVATAFERTRDEVEELTGRQRERLDTTKAVVVELVNAVEQIAKTASDQAVEVSRAARVVFEVARQAEVVVTGIGRVADAAQQVEGFATAARAKVAGALTGMGTTQASVDLGAEAVRQMGIRAGAMVKLLHEIGGMATQTNLLAMNAAHGGAEAEVAAEVQRLADRSAQLARESIDLLAGMQEGVQQAVSFITEGETAVRKGADQVKAAEWSLGEIQQAVQITMQEARTIRTAVDVLFDGHRRLSQTMEMLASLAEENSAAAEEMAAGSETVRSQVQELDTLALQNFASIQAVVPEMQSISRAMERVVQTITRLEAIKEELSQSTATLRA